MKKSIKLIALGLSVIPCALMLTACGGNGDDNLVNIKGDYQAVASNEYNAVVQDIDAGFNLQELAKGLKSVITIDASADLGVMGVVDLSLENESLAKIPSSEGVAELKDLEAYTSLDFKMKMTMGDESTSMSASAKQYIVDGNQYIDLSKAEDLVAMVDPNMPLKGYNTLLTEEVEPLVIPEYTLSSLLEMVPEGTYWGDYVQISKSTSDTGFKYKVVATAEMLNTFVAGAFEGVAVNFTSDLEFYLVYENEEFAGLYLDTSADVSITLPEESPYAAMVGTQLLVKVKLNVQATGFAGEIDYPSSFEDYQPLTPVVE